MQVSNVDFSNVSKGLDDLMIEPIISMLSLIDMLDHLLVDYFGDWTEDEIGKLLFFIMFELRDKAYALDAALERVVKGN